MELARRIRDRELSSRELLDVYLERIERLNPQLNAVVTLDPERARDQAAAADDAVAAGGDLGPLHGVPMTVKDSFETAGMRTTCGVPLWGEHVPAEDAVAVARLKRAGAIVFGKTNLPAYAADLQTYNPLFGVTPNPWAADRTPGGSSGGAAAAVAAGLTALEVGSDIGGSIRTPAHFCGVYGHKPSYGIVPLRGHLPPPPGFLGEADVAVAGPLGRSADDLALAMEVLAGPDRWATAAWRLQLPPPRAETLAGYRVAAWLGDEVAPLDEGVRRPLEEAVRRLEQSGVTVARDRPEFDAAEAHRTFLRLLYSVTIAGLPDGAFAALAQEAELLAEDDDSAAARVARYGTQRHRQWMGADEKRQHLRARWEEFFQRYDVLLCPVNVVAAVPHDPSPELNARTIEVNGEERSYWDQLVWIGMVGAAYLPATVAPVGLTAQGLPVGLQIVGPFLEDRTPIDFARRLAEVEGGFRPPPLTGTSSLREALQ